jgi:hypothetical protein
MQVQGLTKALANLKALGGRIKNKGIRRALKAGSLPVVRIANSQAPRDSGLLAKSHIHKIKSYRRGAVLVSVIGPKNRKYASGKNPGKYSHLVHDGHKNRGGKGRTPGNPYLRRASHSGLRMANAVAQQVLTQEAIQAARALGSSI